MSNLRFRTVLNLNFLFNFGTLSTAADRRAHGLTGLRADHVSSQLPNVGTVVLTYQTYAASIFLCSRLVWLGTELNQRFN